MIPTVAHNESSKLSVHHTYMSQHIDMGTNLPEPSRSPRDQPHNWYLPNLHGLQHLGYSSHHKIYITPLDRRMFGHALPTHTYLSVGAMLHKSKSIDIHGYFIYEGYL
jgi:hypothetical protein